MEQVIQETARLQWVTVETAEEGVSPSDIMLSSLVLEARFVPHSLIDGPEGVRLVVPVWALEKAHEELRLFREENVAWPPSSPAARPVHENVLTTLSILLVLGIFHNFIDLDTFTSIDWRAAGTANSIFIVDGEWWRAITALTLHAGAEHLAGNLAIGGIFIILLCRDVDTGPAWMIILLSGFFGNVANAWVQPSPHLSVGASTAVFGALGALTGISIVRHRGDLRRHWTLPAAAGLALLATLGTQGKNTDLGAHLFGYLFGLLLGFGYEMTVRKKSPRPKSLSLILGLVAAGMVITAWILAAMNPGKPLP